MTEHDKSNEPSGQLPDGAPLDAPVATLWPMLLAKWTEFAKASVAFPRTPEGDAWRAAVPSVITLQAVAMALGELVERLEGPEAQRPARADVALALDKAGVLIDQHERTLLGLWPARGEEPQGQPHVQPHLQPQGRPQGVPAGVIELIGDARAAVEAVLLCTPV